jgi:hypothetical protein
MHLSHNLKEEHYQKKELALVVSFTDLISSSNLHKEHTSDKLNNIDHQVVH